MDKKLDSFLETSILSVQTNIHFFLTKMKKERGKQAIPTNSYNVFNNAHNYFEGQLCILEYIKHKF